MTVSERAVCLCVVTLALLLGAAPEPAEASRRSRRCEQCIPCTPPSVSPRLLIQTKKWEGEYWTKDKPSAVQSTPVTTDAYLVPLDGAPLRRFAAGNLQIEYPNFSPDGRWIYFQSRSSGQLEIYRAREDGSELSCLTCRHPLPGSSYGFQFSRDGAQIIYAVHDGKIARVAIMCPDGSAARILAPELGHCYMASFAPDGRSAVLSHTELGYRLVHTMLDGSQRWQLAPQLQESFGPQFTPDGQFVVFFRRDGDVYRVRRDGSDLKRLTEGNQYVEFKLSAKDEHGSSDGPDISPDGLQIAYLRRIGGVPQVHVMNADGSNPRQLTNGTTPCGRVRWSRDGRSIAFVSFAPLYPQLFVMPSSGGPPRQLTDLGNEAVVHVQWQP